MSIIFENQRENILLGKFKKNYKKESVCEMDPER